MRTDPSARHGRWLVLSSVAIASCVVGGLVAFAFGKRPSGATQWALMASGALACILLVRWQATLLAENARLVSRLDGEALRLRTLLETAPVAIVETDPTGIVRLWNPEAARLFAQSADETIGTRTRIVNAEDPEWGPLRRVRHGDVIRNEQMWMSSPTNDSQDLLVSAAPVYDHAGQLTSVIYVASDHAPVRQAQEALADAEKMRALSRLAGGLAHDFNNLLAVILWTSEAMLTQAGREPQDQDDLNEIIAAGRRAAELIEQLVAFSQRRIDQAGSVDASRVVHGLLPVLDRLTGRHVELRADLETDPAEVRLDAAALELVVTNLVENAADATEERAPVEIRARNVEVADAVSWTTGLVVPGRYLQIDVTDHGRGIVARQRSQVFEPFYSGSDQPSRRGLGLSTVRGIVVQAGGQVDLAEAPDGGTRVRLVLPRLSAPSGAPAAPPADGQVPRSRPRPSRPRSHLRPRPRPRSRRRRAPSRPVPPTR